MIGRMVLFGASGLNRTSSEWVSPIPTCGCPLRLTVRSAKAEARQLEARSTPPRFTAYAHLILDMLNSNPMLFIRGDEAEQAWRIVDPVMKAWSAGDVPDAGIRRRPSIPQAPRPDLPGPRQRTSQTGQAHGWSTALKK